MSTINQFNRKFIGLIAWVLLFNAMALAQAPRPQYLSDEGQVIAAKISLVYGGPQDYIEDFLLEAQRLEVIQGIPAPVVVGIAILESGGFSSFLFSNALNPFGMRATYPWKGETFIMYHEGADAPFRKYSKAREAVQDFSILLYSHIWLADTLNCPDGDVDCYLKKLSASEKPKHPGYSRDPQWGTKIKGIIERYELGKLAMGKG